MNTLDANFESSEDSALKTLGDGSTELKTR